MSEGVSPQMIEAVLRTALAPLQAAPLQRLDVVNESHLHAGHAGAGEGSHFRVFIVADCMTSLSRVARHRLVYDALRDVIPQGIHALAIEAQGPDPA